MCYLLLLVAGDTPLFVPIEEERGVHDRDSSWRNNRRVGVRVRGT